MRSSSCKHTFVIRLPYMPMQARCQDPLEPRRSRAQSGGAGCLLAWRHSAFSILATIFGQQVSTSGTKQGSKVPDVHRKSERLACLPSLLSVGAFTGEQHRCLTRDIYILAFAALIPYLGSSP